MGKDLAKELLGAGVLRVAEESVGRAFFDDLPFSHEDDTVGNLASAWETWAASGLPASRLLAPPPGVACP